MIRFQATRGLVARRRSLRAQSLEPRHVFAAGIDVAPLENLVTSEDGAAVELQVRLTEAPTANVAVNVFLGDSSESQAAPGVLQFTPDNWDTAQSLTITGRDDLLEDGDVAYSIALTADSTDLNYALLPARVLPFINQDNESDNPPRVLAVAVDGSGNAHPEYLVPGGSREQLRTVPVGGLDQVRIYFDQPVTVQASDLTVLGVRTPLHAIESFEYDAASYSARWTLADIVAADRLTLSLAAVVTDSSGFTLDGEWDGPTSLNDPASSAFPSGNGAEGGAFAFHLTVLAGDGNRDNQVTGADFTLWANNFFDPPGSVTFGEGDYDGNGRGNGADFTLWADHFGITFPPLGIVSGGGSTRPGSITTETSTTKAQEPLLSAATTPRREAPTGAPTSGPRGRREIRVGLWEEFS